MSQHRDEEVWPWWFRAGMAFGFLCSAAITAVVIWAIVALVAHFTS